jgi:hypothetical protein
MSRGHAGVRGIFVDKQERKTVISGFSDLISKYWLWRVSLLQILLLHAQLRFYKNRVYSTVLLTSLIIHTKVVFLRLVPDTRTSVKVGDWVFPELV